jgi:hypothetical protein
MSNTPGQPRPQDAAYTDNAKQLGELTRAILLRLAGNNPRRLAILRRGGGE